MKLNLGPLLLLASAGCLDTSGVDTGIILQFDFDVTGSGFVSGVADVPAAQIATVGAVSDFRLLPPNLSATAKGLYLSGTSVGGDLFLFQKKRFSGLTPNTSYQAQITVVYISDYHSGCSGGPGPLTVIKAGATGNEPMVTTDAQGMLRMNLDKGTGTAKGGFVQAGDIRNNLSACPTVGTFSERATLSRDQATPVVTDAQGGLWLFVGTQSSFSGAHRVYFTGVRMTLR